MSEDLGQDNLNDQQFYDEQEPQVDSTTYDENYYNDPNAGATEWVCAIYDHEGAEEGELSFKEGDWIGVLEDYGDGWARGFVEDREGHFPLNLTQKSDTTEVPAEAQLSVSVEIQQKRRQQRELLKEELRNLKEVSAKQNQEKAKAEKEIRELTEASQKLKKELRHLKADLSDKNSLLYDLIKLTHAMDMHFEASKGLSTSAKENIEAISHFSSEYQKEGKSSAALAPYAQKAVPKMKELGDLITTYNAQTEEASKLAKEFRPELEAMIKTLHNKQNK
eukprot:TRINITY_DN3804_c0_g2_i1.p1 TRINITY_DN3804_c0_g2~~TRINITY_DN3804_c0_g2_i1.p1  ORF type:complete len:278 (+),score=95.91 TRINITY_DN3804_c0_g2_i1:136-969(+)